MQQNKTLGNKLQISAPHHATVDSSTHTLRFTGDISSYFRVWLVNRLLTLVTLGLYKPFARRRTAQYFYEHSLVAGSPLEFTAKGRVMMRGFIIGLALAGIYQLTQMSDQEFVWGLAMLVATLWGPFAWHSAMRFRFANTRWRGLRLNFAAHWRQVYAAYWPLLFQTALVVAMFAALTALAPFELDGMFDLAGLLEAFFDSNDDGLFTDAMKAVLLLGAVLLLWSAIQLDYNLRDLVMRRTRFGAQPVTWQRPTFGRFVQIWLVTGLLWAAGLVLLYFLCDFLLDLVWHAAGLGNEENMDVVMRKLLRKYGVLLMVWFFVAATAFMFALIMLTTLGRAYYRASMFKLVWNRAALRRDEVSGADVPDMGKTVSHLSDPINTWRENTTRLARFSCNLSLPAYIWLRCKNTFLTLLTLGFYSPRATLSEYRMRLESVTLHVPGDLDQLTGELARQQVGGLGDVIADTVGLELIG